jgi:hypothetical protein
MKQIDLKLIFDDEYSRLYYDEANQYYVLWLMITHVMWYDVYIRLIQEETNVFLSKENILDTVQFRHFANDVALQRPGLVGKFTIWDDRILAREEKPNLP